MLRKTGLALLLASCGYVGDSVDANLPAGVPDAAYLQKPTVVDSGPLLYDLDKVRRMDSCYRRNSDMTGMDAVNHCMLLEMLDEMD